MDGIELEQVARNLWRPTLFCVMVKDLSREYHSVVMERKCRRSGMHLATVGSLAQTELKQAGLRGFRPQLHCVFEHSTDGPVVVPVSCAGRKTEGEWNTLIDAHVCARFERRKNSVCETSRCCNKHWRCWLMTPFPVIGLRSVLRETHVRN